MAWQWKVAETLIQRVAHEVTSADKAYQTLRAAGFDVRRADVRGAWNDYNIATGYEGPLSQWRTDRKPPKSWIGIKETTEATGLMQMLHYEKFNPVTGETKTGVWSIITDEVMPYSKLIEMATEDLAVYGAMLGETISKVRAGGVVRLTPKS